MPFYCYTNKKTGETIREFMTVDNMLKNAADGISIDGVYYERDISAEHTRSYKKASGNNWPLKSDAAGVHPSQTSEFQEKTAKLGVPTEFDKKTGQAVFRSRGHRAKYMKAMGFHDRNGGYGDG